MQEVCLHQFLELQAPKRISFSHTKRLFRNIHGCMVLTVILMVISYGLKKYLKLEYSFSLPLGSKNRDHFSYKLNNEPLLAMGSPRSTGRELESI